MQYNTNQNSKVILYKYIKTIQKFLWRHRRSRIVKEIPKKKNTGESTTYLISNYTAESWK